ncbi:hypothetical protein VQU67_003826, partial [Acinetobacter baumannii]|nr:hypothetical protein [Acinetobacter baumannii]
LTAELFNVDKLSAITGELGTLITYKDPSQPQKARMVISGTALKLYDDNNIERIYIGL